VKKMENPSYETHIVILTLYITEGFAVSVTDMMVLRHLYVTAVFVNMASGYGNENIFSKAVYQVCHRQPNTQIIECQSTE